MAFDLWGPSFIQDTEDSSYHVQPEWQYDDYHFGFEFGGFVDVVEEDALNEKYCIQVLRILIRNADSEIDELEKDLVTLQSELALVEYDEWSEICCSTLKKKVDYLEISVRTLRNKDKNDLEVHLLMHTEPAEKLHEIMKALLRSYYQEKDEKSQDDAVLGSASGTTGHVLDLMCEQQQLRVADSNIKAKEESRGSSIIPSENYIFLNQFDGLQERKTNNSEIVKLANTDSKDQTQDSLSLEAYPSSEKKVCTKLDAECSGKQEAKEQNYSLEDKRANQNSTLKSAGKRVHYLEQFKPAEDAWNHATDHLDKKKKWNASGLKILREDVKEHSSRTAAALVILNSSSKPMGDRAVLGKKVKTANGIFKNPGSNAPKQLSGHSSDVKKLCKVDSKCNAVEVPRYCASATWKIKTSGLSFTPEHAGNVLKADKPGNAMAKSVSLDTLRIGTGLNKGKDSESKLQAIGDEKSFNCDIEQKICDFAVKAVRKRSAKELKIASSDIIESSNLLSKGLSKRDPLKVVQIKEDDTEHSTITSLLELQGRTGEDNIILQIKEEKPQLKGVKIAENSANTEEDITYSSMAAQGEKEKKNVESNQQNPRKLDPLSVENILNSPSVSEARRPWEAAEISGLNYSLNGRMTKKIVQHVKCGAEKHKVIQDDRQNLGPPLLKKSKKASSAPIILEIRSSGAQIDLSKLHGNPTDGRSKAEFSVSKSHSVDNSCTEVEASSPSVTSNLQDMKLCDLRAIAKEQKLTKYAKLRKSDLVDLIANRLS